MESTSDTVFSGHNMIAIHGELRDEVFFNEPKTGIYETEVDFGEINYKRRHETNLKDALHRMSMPLKKIAVSFDTAVNFKFSQPLEKLPFIPKENKEKAFTDIRSIQTRALSRRLIHMGTNKIIIGVSGGLDSTLALLAAKDAIKFLGLSSKEIIGVSMPGLGTSDRTKANAAKLMSLLKVTQLEKSIVEETLSHFKLIEQDENKTDVTYENTQARIRTMLLMNLANKENGMVLGTGRLI